MSVEYQQEIVQVCQWWLNRGFALLPAQRDKKYLLGGYGQFQRKIENIDQALEIFTTSNRFNLAVSCPRDRFILDFDDMNLYASWNRSNIETYTEITPVRGGAHVFFLGCVPDGLVARPGVEFLKVCLVYPSMVEGKQYIQGNGEIAQADVINVFAGLTQPGTKTVYLRYVEEKKARRSTDGESKISRIKREWDIKQVFEKYRPGMRWKGNGRMLSSLCPWHKDKHASFFIDLELQRFKCHACGVQGDVINAYARLNNITNSEAIAKMAGDQQ